MVERNLAELLMDKRNPFLEGILSPCAVQIFNHELKILKNFPNTLRSSAY